MPPKTPLKTKSSSHVVYVSFLLSANIHIEPSYRQDRLALRRSGEDLRGGLVLVLLEVLLEQAAELGDLALEVGGAGPALGRVEELVGHAGAGLGDGEVEAVVHLVLLVGELAGVDGVEDGAGVLELWDLSMNCSWEGEWIGLNVQGSACRCP